jgi:hypothetical protein
LHELGYGTRVTVNNGLGSDNSFATPMTAFDGRERARDTRLACKLAKGATGRCRGAVSRLEASLLATTS